MHEREEKQMNGMYVNEQELINSNEEKQRESE